MEVRYKDLGLIDYKETWDYQESVFNKIIDYKTGKRSEPPTYYLLFCEHLHVYTLGKSGEKNNLLINDQFLAKINASYYKIDRGGDITYHGPGQLVAYPILDLEKAGVSLKEYIYNLEEAIILTLADFGIITTRLDGATGVWIDVNVKSKTRKICAIGVRASRFVTMHGFALNVNTDLSYFNHINPCGFIDKGVTSMEKELNIIVDFQEVKNKLKEKIAMTLNFNYDE